MVVLVVIMMTISQLQINVVYAAVDQLVAMTAALMMVVLAMTVLVMTVLVMTVLVMTVVLVNV